MTDELLLRDSLTNGGTTTVRLARRLLLNTFTLVIVHIRSLSNGHLPVIDRVKLLERHVVLLEKHGTIVMCLLGGLSMSRELREGFHVFIHYLSFLLARVHRHLLHTRPKAIILRALDNETGDSLSKVCSLLLI